MTEQPHIQDIVYSIVTSPNFAQDGVCFAARLSGLYRSDDGGETWRSAYEALDPGTVLTTTTVVLSPDFDSDRSIFAGVPGAILRSVDGGSKWFLTELPKPAPVISSLIISPHFTEDATLLLGSVEDGVYRSEDRGMNWMACNFGLTDLSVFTMAISHHFADDTTVYLGTESGIFRSTNGGRAWKETGFPDDLAPVLSLVLSPEHTDDGILWAGTESCGLFYSDDRGQTWKQIARKKISKTVNAIAVSPKYPAQPHVLVMTSHILLVSRDGGSSWSEWEEGFFAEQGLACLATPHGLETGSSLLLGLADGNITRL